MSIEIIDTLKQKNSQSFAIVDSNDLMGGFYQVGTTEERDAIPYERRKIGMLCYVDGEYTYQLIGGLENENWEVFDGEIDLSVFALKEDTYSINEIDEKLNELKKLISDLDDRLAAIENPIKAKAICGTFLSGELKSGEGLPKINEAYKIRSFLSDNFKNKFGVNYDE